MTMTEAPVDLGALLNRATAASRRLARSADVPAEVVAFVEDLGRSLQADAPLRLAVDPYLSTTLFAGALQAVSALRDRDQTARRLGLRVALEQVRQALRDIEDAAPVAADQPIGLVLARLVEVLRVAQPQLAGLLGISTRQLQRWLAGGEPSGDDEARVRVVAQVANQLRHVFTGPGVLRWFERPHPRLGRPPAELLDDPLQYPQLRELATATRAW
jgi:hypothetical protein